MITKEWMLNYICLNFNFNFIFSAMAFLSFQKYIPRHNWLFMWDYLVSNFHFRVRLGACRQRGANSSIMAFAIVYITVWRLHLQCGRLGFDPWAGKIPWRRESIPTPVFWPGEFHGLYSPWGHQESDTTERLSLSDDSLIFIIFFYAWLTLNWIINRGQEEPGLNLMIKLKKSE